MEQLNKIELRGMVGNVKIQTFNDNKMLKMTLATSYAYRDKEGTPVIDTSWHNIVAWEGKNIQNLEQYQKGDKVYVCGRLRYQKYTGLDGVDRTSTDILAGRVMKIEDPEPLQNEM